MARHNVYQFQVTFKVNSKQFLYAALGCTLNKPLIKKQGCYDSQNSQFNPIHETAFTIQFDLRYWIHNLIWYHSGYWVQNSLWFRIRVRDLIKFRILSSWFDSIRFRIMSSWFNSGSLVHDSVQDPELMIQFDSGSWFYDSIQFRTLCLWLDSIQKS